MALNANEIQYNRNGGPPHVKYLKHIHQKFQKSDGSS